MNPMPDYAGLQKRILLQCSPPGSKRNSTKTLPDYRREYLTKLKNQYDGYHFCPEGMGVYNPYSLVKAFYEKDFGAYWFETGTPSFLVKQLREAQFDV